MSLDLTQDRKQLRDVPAIVLQGTVFRIPIQINIFNG